MKKQLYPLLLLTCAALLPTAAPAQTAAAFSAAAIRRSGTTDRIVFSVTRETATRYYLIEGTRGEDSLSYEILSRIEASRPSRISRAYAVNLYDTAIRRYRIRQVDGTAATTAWSAILTPATDGIPAFPHDNAAATATPIALKK